MRSAGPTDTLSPSACIPLRLRNLSSEPPIRLLVDVAKLPSAYEMQSHIGRFHIDSTNAFPVRPRHAMEVDLPEDYLRALGRERRAGIRRVKDSR